MLNDKTEVGRFVTNIVNSLTKEENIDGLIVEIRDFSDKRQIDEVRAAVVFMTIQFMVYYNSYADYIERKKEKSNKDIEI